MLQGVIIAAQKSKGMNATKTNLDNLQVNGGEEGKSFLKSTLIV